MKNLLLLFTIAISTPALAQYPLGWPCNAYSSHSIFLTKDLQGGTFGVSTSKTLNLHPGEIFETGLFINQSNGQITFWPVKVSCSIDQSTQYGSIKIEKEYTAVFNDGSVIVHCSEL